MKKLLIIVAVLLLGIGLVGCYYDYSKRDMELVDVKVYDVDDNEIIGEYRNYYDDLFTSLMQSSKLGFEKCNSAAPVENYYCINAMEQTSYTVKFYFCSINNKGLTKLVLTNDDNEIILECTDIEEIDDQLVVTFTIQNMTTETQFYRIYIWNDGKEVSHRFSTQGSNTYIKGVYFKLATQTETSCLN